MGLILVWDIPTRLLHLALTVMFLAALGIALAADDESPLFLMHMLFGLAAAVIVAFRAVWGVFGSKYARFTSFLFGPKALSQYLRGAVTGTAPRHVGHNPGSAYAIYSMLLLTLALGATGWLISGGNERFEELHGLFAYAMLAVVLSHLMGIIWHTVRHRENIAWSMVSGRKMGEPSQAIRSDHPFVGIAFLVLWSAWTASLFASYDPSSGQVSLPILGSTVRLGKIETDEERRKDDSERNDRPDGDHHVHDGDGHKGQGTLTEHRPRDHDKHDEREH